MARAPQSSLPTVGDALTRSSARADKQRTRTRILLGIVLLLALALVIVIGVVVIKGGLGGGNTAAPSGGGDCIATELRVTADPDIAVALQTIVEDLDSAGGDCPDVTVRSEESAVTAAVLGEGGDPGFDVWVPDSSMWPARATGLAEIAEADAAELVVGDTVATTPVVFATTETTAAAVGADGAGFSSFAGGGAAVVLPDPTAVASSSAALLALQTAFSGDARMFTGMVLSLANGIVPTADEALAAAATAETPTVAVTTEQAVLNHDADLVSIFPSDVKPAVSMPIVTLGDASEETTAAVETFTAAITAASATLADAGLREADGTPGADFVAEGSEDGGAAAQTADSVNQAEVLRTWQVLTAPSRMLSLNDVSGSMFEPVTGDMRRIDLFEQAAVRAVNSLSADSSLATWVFSTRRIGGQDWQEIAPFGPLSDAAHKQRTIDTANGLDKLVGGGTGLYDSVLAAVKYMRETYVPGQVNLVLLNTDGVNEDDDGLDLDGLLAELEKLHDPAAPVAVIAIGYGPDTDQSVLEQIAAATDGAAYQALEPTDITTVLVDAVTQRGCRPFCA
ncbi:hypothetical protein [Microbacterium sp. bgisy189]|uniref:hypothetical protein n=1 Tax=Microbacterium sp. bgisy189 TaxID=3413798 RepID=UPI003EC03F73